LHGKYSTQQHKSHGSEEINSPTQEGQSHNQCSDGETVRRHRREGEHFLNKLFRRREASSTFYFSDLDNIRLRGRRGLTSLGDISSAYPLNTFSIYINKVDGRRLYRDACLPYSRPLCWDCIPTRRNICCAHQKRTKVLDCKDWQK